MYAGIKYWSASGVNNGRTSWYCRSSGRVWPRHVAPRKCPLTSSHSRQFWWSAIRSSPGYGTSAKAASMDSRTVMARMQPNASAGHRWRGSDGGFAGAQGWRTRFSIHPPINKRARRKPHEHDAENIHADIHPETGHERPPACDKQADRHGNREAKDSPSWKPKKRSWQCSHGGSRLEESRSPRFLPANRQGSCACGWRGSKTKGGPSSREQPISACPFSTPQCDPAARSLSVLPVVLSSCYRCHDGWRDRGIRARLIFWPEIDSGHVHETSHHPRITPGTA